MKTAGLTLSSWLATLNHAAECWRTDLITLTLVDGTTHYHWTTADFNILDSGNLYYASGGGSAPLISRGPYRQSARLSIDTIDLDLSGPFSIGGIVLQGLARNGYFDGARVTIHHLMGAYPGDLSKGAIYDWFEGPVAGVEINGQRVLLRCKSQLELMNIELPRFSIQPQCGNALYDVNCAVTGGKIGWTVSGTVSSATTTTITTTTAALLSKADNYFNLGVITFTYGALLGTRRAIQDWVQGTGVLTLAIPLPSAPSNGDTFTVYPGCNKSYATCDNRFSNLAHFRGFVNVPRPEAGA
jgi:uncharacterized phage protein (TIGR02218 family)